MSRGMQGINNQIGSSEGSHVSGTLHSFMETAYMYGRVAPFSGIGAADLIYHYLMAQ
ncbi:MAG: hypothetical protein ACN6OP_04540 [Pseudomonadales bacterium]